VTAAEKRRAGALALAIAGLHVLGFGVLLAGGALGVGVGLTAYTLGLRHAFDADHIAAIDNTTRKLMGDGQRPLSVGFWFSLGHSTVVLGLGAGVMLGVRGVSADVHQVTGVIGPAVSGTFLLLIGVLNLMVLVGVVRVFRRMRHGGDADDAGVAGGLLTRVYGRATRAVSRSWHMYPLGVLFGLGFDTATEVALLILAGGAAAGGLPFYAVLCLPVLFAAGMSLFDTLDGAFMNVAYGWALSDPVRKIYYNITITVLSVVVALLVGAIELLGLLHGGPGVDLNLLGYAIVALFVATWAIALAVWRVGRIEERWAVHLDQA
jgi:high-affinity nickel-transport protein